MKLKIGQEVEITQDFEIEAELSGKKVLVKKGDRGFVDSRGRIHYTSGNAIGKIQLLKDSEVKGYDTENIAEMIFNRLKRVFDIDEFLDDYDISKDDFINEVDDVLMDIL